MSEIQATFQRYLFVITSHFALISQERAAQARITDLEAQLSRATATATQLKRSKDEVIWH